jgi:hypothetical protein
MVSNIKSDQSSWLIWRMLIQGRRDWQLRPSVFLLPPLRYLGLDIRRRAPGGYIPLRSCCHGSRREF